MRTTVYLEWRFSSDTMRVAACLQSGAWVGTSDLQTGPAYMAFAIESGSMHKRFTVCRTT